MKICVTGGAGFIGSAFVHRLLEPSSTLAAAGEKSEEDTSVVVLDDLTYAGNLENLERFKGHKRFEFVKGSINDPEAVSGALDGCDVVVNFAAESHVDRSLTDAGSFVKTNVDGTRVLLDEAVSRKLRFMQVSTDEVYGSLGEEGLFTEDSPLDPSSPYAASKAAADLLVGAYTKSYGLDAVITRCGNNYGPRQFPEKLIPLFITGALEDRELPLYGDGLNVRDWIHVDDHCEAILAVVREGKQGRVYNVSASSERSNLELCRQLLELVGKPWDLVRYVSDRPGHDRRYALAAGRLRSELGWQPKVALDDGLAQTVEWYRSNRGWWQRIKSGDYLEYYEKLYGERLRGAEGKDPGVG